MEEKLYFKILKYFAISFPFLCLLISTLFHKETSYEETLKLEYRGIIQEKKILRVNRLQVLSTNGKIIEVMRAHYKLYEKCVVGDSIHKLPDSNLCILKKSDGKEFVLEYIYIPQ